MIFLSATAVLIGFQNCGNDVAFTEKISNLGSLGVCSGVSCDLTPLTATPAVVTILMALGDQANSQLVVKGASAQLIAETVVRYASPENDPKVLLVKDRARGTESASDSDYAKDVLLARYQVTQIEEPVGGLLDSDVSGYDLIWFNNPGTPMGLAVSRDTLIRFRGGVIMQGDDLAHGSTSGTAFSMEALTGLRFIDNGTDVTCAGVKYNHNDNNGEKFRVSLDPTKIPGANAATIAFEYGNDIDTTEVSRPGLEVVAYAQGGPAACTEKRPAIVRYLKN